MQVPGSFQHSWLCPPQPSYINYIAQSAKHKMDQDLALLIHSSFHLRQGGNLTDEVSTAEGLLETSA